MIFFFNNKNRKCFESWALTSLHFP